MSEVALLSIIEINKKLEKLWTNTDASIRGDLAPLIARQPRKNALLFVGMNPSFSESGWKKILSNTKFENLNVNTFYRWPRNCAEGYSWDHDLQLEELARKHYERFFGLQHCWCISLGVEWEHLDMFAIRDTKQKNVTAVLYKKGNGIIKLTEFGAHQVQIFEELLTEANPQAVVIANAAASEIYQSVRKTSILFNDDCGYHTDLIGKRRVPVFFSSMLTGQRALDLGSRRRLFWQIASALGKKSIEYPDKAAIRDLVE